MKVTSLKDMESYIYSSVILPLKDLDVQLHNSSPITANNGNILEFSVGRERLDGDFDHNYQRDAARDQLRWLVTLRDGYSSFIVADYETKRHVVRIYKEAFDQFEKGGMLYNKLIEAFGKYTPFGDIKYVGGIRESEIDLSQVPF